MNFPDDMGEELNQAVIEGIFRSNWVTNQLGPITLNQKQRKVISKARKGGWGYHKIVKGYEEAFISAFVQIVRAVEKTEESFRHFFCSFDVDTAFIVNAVRNCVVTNPVAVVVWGGQCHPLYSIRTTEVMPGLARFLCRHRCIDLGEYVEEERDDVVAIRAMARKANTLVVKTGGEGFAGKIPQELIVHGRLIDPVRLGYSDSETRRMVLGMINM